MVLSMIQKVAQSVEAFAGLIAGLEAGGGPKPNRSPSTCDDMQDAHRSKKNLLCLLDK